MHIRGGDWGIPCAVQYAATRTRQPFFLRVPWLICISLLSIFFPLAKIFFIKLIYVYSESKKMVTPTPKKNNICI